MSEQNHVNQIVTVIEYGVVTKKSKKPVEPPIVSKRLALITAGSYLGGYGRVSNHWEWSYVNEDGTLEAKTMAGYDNGAPFRLLPAEGYVLEKRVVKIEPKEPVPRDCAYVNADELWFTNRLTPISLTGAIDAAAKLDGQLREIANGERKPGKIAVDDIADLIAYVRQMAKAQF